MWMNSMGTLIRHGIYTYLDGLRFWVSKFRRLPGLFFSTCCYVRAQISPPKPRGSRYIYILKNKKRNTFRSRIVVRCVETMHLHHPAGRCGRCHSLQHALCSGSQPHRWHRRLGGPNNSTPSISVHFYRRVWSIRGRFLQFFSVQMEGLQVMEI